jgi:hypothetical protein
MCTRYLFTRHARASRRPSPGYPRLSLCGHKLGDGRAKHGHDKQAWSGAPPNAIALLERDRSLRASRRAARIRRGLGQARLWRIMSGMRIAVLLLLLWLPLCAEAKCPAPRSTPGVTVLPLLPAVQETHSASYHELSRKMKQALKPGLDTMGLSSSRLDSKYHFDFKVLHLSGRYCYYLTSIEAQFGYDYRLVQIASEVPEGSCVYDEIRKHEYKHVAVDQSVVLDNFSYVTSQLQAFGRSLGVVEAGSDQEAERRLDSALHAAMQPILAHVAALRTAAQDRVDTPQEYARVEQACRITAGPVDSTASPAPSRPLPLQDGNHR